MIYEKLEDLHGAMTRAGIVSENESVHVDNIERVREGLIDDLAWTAVFSTDSATRDAARDAIHDLAWLYGAIPASIQGFYEARGRQEVEESFTVPAHNIRTLTYDMARALFRAANAKNVGPFIFEIARSEIGYTEQRPAEYAACVLAAAIKEGYRGPVFIQGDHFQASAKKWKKEEERDKEREALEGLIEEAIAAEFYNIDIDSSTLVDLSHEKLSDQQRLNYELTAHLTKFIRKHQPRAVQVSIGGEIGEVGTENTTPEEFRAYIDGLRPLLPEGMKGPSKVSIQTGTSHGGVPLPDGSVAQVSIDFDRIREITRIAQEEYGISGAVQHGASTLPEEVFDHFPKADTVEIHLATGFQNMVYDHPSFPADLKNEIRQWCDTNAAGEKKEGQTGEQFFYKTRKKALGPFKKRLWELPEEIKGAIMSDLEAKFAFLFEKLGVIGTKDVIHKYVPTEAAPRPDWAGSHGASKSHAMAFVNEGEGE